MFKRWFDLVAALCALFLLSPLIILISVILKIISKGPIFYRANRAGLNGKEFTMYKFRTMRINVDGKQSKITSAKDSRVFPVGRLLRATKLDELPQLFNVVLGQMSIVGPRPEDPKIVDSYYSLNDKKTLLVRPGLASPGSLYNYTHGEIMLSSQDAEHAYVQKLLPIKLALEQVYVKRANIIYDFWIILRTIVVIFKIALGIKNHSEPPEMFEARKLMD